MSPAPLKIPSDLKRYPVRQKDLLQAWDAADELLLEHLETEAIAEKAERILILDDHFGALTTALREFRPEVYTDSFVAAKAIIANTSVHPSGRIEAKHSLADLEGPYDLILARIPKNLSFFEDQLATLSSKLKPGAQLICATMVKYQAAGAFDLIDRYVGPTRTSLAKKKARLIFAEFSRTPRMTPYPIEVPIEGFKHPFTHHSNLFSREKLDVGTRFFIERIPGGDFDSILDLGCANGIVGILAKRKNPDARVIFTDDSWMAVESARANWAKYFPEDSSAESHWTNCYEEGKPETVNLVLCNPPFHQGTTLGDHVAKQMFRDAHRVLRPGGLLRVIGNSHLKYPAIIERLFGNSEIVDRNPKFTIVDALKE